MKTPPTRTATKRVNVDFPTAMLADIDRECARIGVARQAWIKLALAAKLQHERAFDRGVTYGQE